MNFAKLSIAAAALSLGFAAQAAEPQPSVVIVHGAFADGSDWAKVIPLLQAKGVHVTAVQNPLTSLDDDVAAAKRAIDAAPGKVVLVGHSWGGVVITQAGANDKVASLVYIAAFAPDAGQAVGDLGKAYPAPVGLTFARPDAAGFPAPHRRGHEQALRAGPACSADRRHGRHTGPHRRQGLR